MKAQLMLGFLAVSTSTLGNAWTMSDKTTVNGVIHGGFGSNLIQQDSSGVIHSISNPNRHGSIIASNGRLNSNTAGDKTGINASGSNGSVSNGTAGIQE
jgi:hypothetical protein